ncbi:unnamed protein product (macronuclear) [Paramecium tetraurelia]|uniref:Uncharacterized protein n=1 Tax=Paramecium tetraurelia TaxID=5888 RepID=A0DW36_PARTE|nr:uncharacterized protein GSPATT00020906001 [Paramecium tetraurelia]CAK87253.1 unnamed protein product [Paramecium tetraurelia]|eukprot:XP_001454650.1 hypothetical protein (macronuclear) [Paramecium tetraurelia strain d4-2]
MYNYYRKEKFQQITQQKEKKMEQEQNATQETKKINNALATNYDKRIMSFLERMSQKPYVIHDSIYIKESRSTSNDNRRWLNASALHSLEYYQNNKINNRYLSDRKQLKHKLTETIEDIQNPNTSELSILDTFNPKKMDSRRDRQKQITIIDSNLIKRNMRINLDKIQVKRKLDKQDEPKDRLYFKGLKSLTVQQRMFDDEQSKRSISGKARSILEKCNIISKKP